MAGSGLSSPLSKEWVWGAWGPSENVVLGGAEIIHCGWEAQELASVKSLFICAFGETLRSAVWGMLSLNLPRYLYSTGLPSISPLMSSLLLKAPQ